ncbi:MAG TPA: hypothetical protein VGC45_00910 [Gryllotalpicola sp.]
MTGNSVCCRDVTADCPKGSADADADGSGDAGTPGTSFRVQFSEPGTTAYARDARKRAYILAMIPRPSATNPLAPLTPIESTGITWSLVSGAELNLAYRTRDFATPEAALEDLEWLARRAPALKPVPVRDVGQRHHSWWLSLDGEVVLVAAQPFSPSVAVKRAYTAARALFQLRDELG